MHREGHIGAALLAYAPVGGVALALGFDTFALVGGVVAVGLSMLPDYDQQIPGLDHRGLTHTVWFALLVGLVLAVVGATWVVLDALGTPPAVVAAGLSATGYGLYLVVVLSRGTTSN